MKQLTIIILVFFGIIFSVQQVKANAQMKWEDVSSMQVYRTSGGTRTFNENDGIEAFIIQKVIEWINTASPVKETPELADKKAPIAIIKIKMKNGNVAKVEPAYDCHVENKTKFCTLADGDVILTRNNQKIRLKSVQLFDWLLVKWKHERTTPPQDTKELMINDILMLLLGPEIDKAVSNYYSIYYNETPMVYPYEIEIEKVARIDGFRTFHFLITLEITPVFGAHNPVGKDRLTFEIAPTITGQVKLEKFEHLESYELPPHLQDLIKQKMTISQTTTEVSYPCSVVLHSVKGISNAQGTALITKVKKPYTSSSTSPMRERKAVGIYADWLPSPSSFGAYDRYEGFAQVVGEISWRFKMYSVREDVPSFFGGIPWVGKIDEISAKLPVKTRLEVRLSNSKTNKLGPVVLQNTLQGCRQWAAVPTSASISKLTLNAFAKSQEVVPFLQPLINELSENTNVPVLLPTYWNAQNSKSKQTSVKVKAYENYYKIYFLTTPYRNDPELFPPPESNRIGELYGFVGNLTLSERPSNFVFYKKKEGVKLWIQPWIRSVIYARRGPWSMLFDGDNGDEPYQQADNLFEAMKKTNWLKNRNIQEGTIAIHGTRRNADSEFVWQTDDGFVYHFHYKGPIKESVKIVNSLKYVN